MTIGRIVAVVLLIAVLAGMGIALYDAGIAAGINQAVQQAAQDGQTVAVAPYPYAPYWHGAPRRSTTGTA